MTPEIVTPVSPESDAVTAAGMGPNPLFTVALMPVRLPVMAIRLVTVAFRPTKKDELTVLPDVPPVQLSVMSPIFSANPSMWTLAWPPAEQEGT